MKRRQKMPLGGIFIIGLLVFVGFAVFSPEASPLTNQTNTTACLAVTESCNNQSPSGGGGSSGGGSSCTPTPETCDGRDNNCDGAIDENGVCNQQGTNYLSVSPGYQSSASTVCNNRYPALITTPPKNYETIIDAQLNTPNIVQTIPCTLGSCLWVPWYSTSSTNSVNSLKTTCNVGTVDETHNCMVTDEFSQVGLELSMADNHEQEMIAWANTVKLLASGKYGSIPVWMGRRDGNTITSATSNQDTASDATGRIVTALYIGSNNQHYSLTTRAMLKLLADTIARDQLRYEYTHTCKATEHYGTICHWLASGSNAGTGGLSWNEYSYGGYSGDVILGQLAAYKSTGDTIFLQYAQDTARGYLAAAHYDGKQFSVPPIRYNWISTNGVQTSKCVSVLCTGLGGWSSDAADQVRWTSVCKAQYEASLNGVTLNKDLGHYCEQATTIPCYSSNGWCVQVNADGTNTRASQGGIMSNGLGASLNFYSKQGDLPSRMSEIFNGHFSSGQPDGQTFGVYNNAFAVISLGSSTGRDTSTYGSQTGGQYCT